MEELTAIFVAEPKQYYAIDVRGYIEPHDQAAILSIVDDSGRIHSRSMFNANSGMFNAYASILATNFEGVVVLQVKLEHANWILDSIVAPSLEVRRVQ